KLIHAAAMGNLADRINTGRFQGSAKDLVSSFNQLLDAVATPLHEAQGVLTAMASGDLTKQMTGAYQGEFEQMKMSLNTAITQLTHTVSLVRGAVEAVTAGSEEISKGSDDLAKRTSEQAGALEETSASMEEMTSTVKQNADNSKQANQLAIAARDIANKGGAVTTRAVDAMGEINKSSKKIADIITVIDEIAFQTNLLALNAAVEAARAGEHGRGFAVVAAEVRNLAQRSATAAKEIKGLINESIQRVTDGTELVNQSGKTLEEIVGSVKRVTDIIAEISAASQEQASGIDQVNKAIMQMDEGTQQNAALVEETASASQSMKEQAKELLEQMNIFKTSQSAVTMRAKVTARGDRPHGMGQPKAVSIGEFGGSRGEAKKPIRTGSQPAGSAPTALTVGAKDRRAAADDFEEF
ncbi:MAG TPA: methyl-accepting chemotaxis protein, partial [Nitrospiraceae bacterium]|nr:methyl-accepting chemotaxis protein [Nitrospiraceae bacterium]